MNRAVIDSHSRLPAAERSMAGSGTSAILWGAASQVGVASQSDITASAIDSFEYVSATEVL